MDLASTDKLLTTTRSVRKRLDFHRPVEREVLEACIEVAMQAPTGSNQQGWHFVMVTDADKKMALADLYRKSFDVYKRSVRSPEAEVKRQVILDSASYLSEHMHEVPVLVLACIEGRVEKSTPAAQASLYGSILPAAWSFMLALRSRGLGASWTTLHLVYEKEAAVLLTLPDNITQAVLLPVAYYTGDDFKPANRLSAAVRTHWNTW